MEVLVCPEFAVSSAEELESVRKRWLTEGRTVLPYDVPDKGGVGFVSWIDGPEGEDDVRRVFHFPHGRLRPSSTTVLDAAELRSLYDVHSPHPGFAAAGWPDERVHGFRCPCGSAAGVMTIEKAQLGLLKALAGEDPELFAAVTPASIP